MKKIIPIMLCGAILASLLTGCAGEGQQSANVQAVEPVEAVVEATTQKPTFQVGETVLTIGESTVNDLVEAGAAFGADSLVQSIDFSEDPLFQREMKFAAGATNITIQAKNMTESISPIKDSVIKSVYFDGVQVCGIGGVMIGDTVEQVEEKLGKPYLIINAENYRYNQGEASMTQNTRIYGYTAQYDDVDVRVCIDRNTSQVVLIEEVEPTNLITEPRQMSDEQINALITAHDANRTAAPSAMLMDSGEKNTVSGTLSNIKYDRIKVLTVNNIRDSKAFYENRNMMYDRAVASTYLVVEYSATLTQNPGSDQEVTSSVVGCFYVPNAHLTDEGAIASGLSNMNWKDAAGVYKSEETMMRDLFPDADQGYSLTDFTVMEQTIN